MKRWRRWLHDWDQKPCEGERAVATVNPYALEAAADQPRDSSAAVPDPYGHMVRPRSHEGSCVSCGVMSAAIFANEYLTNIESLMVANARHRPFSFGRIINPRGQKLPTSNRGVIPLENHRLKGRLEPKLSFAALTMGLRAQL